MNAIVQHGDVSQTDRQWAAAAHLSALVLALLTSWTAGFAGMLAAGIIYLSKRDDSAFIAAHAREAFNFNLSMFLYACAVCVAGFLLLGATVLTLGIGLIVALPLWGILALVWIVCTLVAAFKAYDGQPYRYPVTIRLFK